MTQQTSSFSATVEAVRQLRNNPMYHDCKGPRCLLCNLLDTFDDENNSDD